MCVGDSALLLQSAGVYSTALYSFCPNYNTCRKCHHSDMVSYVILSLSLLTQDCMLVSVLACILIQLSLYVQCTIYHCTLLQSDDIVCMYIFITIIHACIVWSAFVLIFNRNYASHCQISYCICTPFPHTDE